MSTLSERLAVWVADLSYDDLPDDVVAAAKRQVLGILGASYAGLNMDTAAGLHAAVDAFGDREEATVIGGAARTSMRTAAMANSFLAQILEYEDWVILSHAGAAVVPAAIACAEARGLDGRALLTAIVAGDEIVGRSGEVMGDATNLGNAVPNHQIEVPLVAGKLLGLDAERLADAVGVSCTQPQVTSLIAWTAPAKGLLTGWPVYVGITAAQLAAAGVVGSHDVLDNALGFISRASHVPSADRLALMEDGLGTEWRTRTLVTKPYPADGFIMTAIEAAIDVSAQAAGRTIELVTAFINVPFAATATLFSEAGLDVYDKIRDRRDWSYIALQYDGLHTIAAALVDGELTWRQWRDDRLFAPEIVELTRRIELVPDLTVGVWGAEIVAALADGSTVSARRDCIPQSDELAERKFTEAARPFIGSRADDVVAAVRTLETVADVSEVTSLL